MKNEIYSNIQENKSISFDELYKKLSSQPLTKQELGLNLRELEKEKLIFFYDNSYYDLNQFEDMKGFSQWNLNGFCWISDKEESNEYGITFNINNELIPIFNKKDTFYGDKTEGKLINIDDKQFFYVTKSTDIKPIKVIASYNEEINKWIVLNSSLNFSINNSISKTELSNGDIAIFEYNSNTFLEKFGNINEFGIESKIISNLADIKESPLFNEKYNSVSNKINLDIPFYTIDSIYTSDVDDAIHIEKKSDNNFVLHVAIADVSSYVIPNSEQDNHAQKVANSFYLPHKTVHMLDRKLAEDKCSLNIGESKSSLVCKIIFDNEGNLINKEFFTANINIKSRLSYEDVNLMLDNLEPKESFILHNNNKEHLTLSNANEILDSLKVLKDFSILKQSTLTDRFNIDSIDYSLNQNGKIDHLFLNNTFSHSQKMVESAMLSANIAAAQFLSEKYPNIGLFRNQVTPDNINKPNPAFYNQINEGHWGLQTEYYTHFTSPIRRYCDLIVHRLIKNIINNENPIYSLEELNNISEQINVQQYKSKQISNKAKNILISQYTEELYKNNLFDQKLTIIDYNDSGLLTRNSQLIDIFIPTFKLETYVLNYLNKFIESDKKDPSTINKQNNLEIMSNKWDLYMQFGSYSWTDERKNTFYQFQTKNKPKP